MSKEISWSPSAINDFETILDYLKKEWNQTVAEKFLISFEFLITQIKHNPKLFPFLNPKLNLRKCVISKHNSIIYRENKEIIEIVRIFDTRQHPKKLKVV